MEIKDQNISESNNSDAMNVGNASEEAEKEKSRSIAQGEVSTRPSYTGGDPWSACAEDQIKALYGTTFDENEAGAEEKLRTLVNFEITDSKGNLVSIDGLDKNSAGYKGPLLVRGYLIPRAPKEWIETLNLYASSVYNREMKEEKQRAAGDGGSEVAREARLSAGYANENGGLERSLLRVGTDLDGYCNNMCEWTYAKVAEVRGSMVKVHFEGKKTKHDEWVEKSSQRLAPIGTHLTRDSGRVGVEAECVPWFEPELLHALVAKKSNIDPFTDEARTTWKPVEIGGIEDWRIDYQYSNPNLWLISQDTGAWYRVGGNTCPGGFRGSPTSAYKPFFESMTTKFCTCAHVAMVLFDCYPASTKVTVSDILKEVASRACGQISEQEVLLYHALVCDQMKHLPRPSDWGKHVKSIAESLFLTNLPKVGEAAAICLENLRRRKKEAEKVLAKVKADSSYGVEFNAKAGRRSKAEIEASEAAARASGLVTDAEVMDSRFERLAEESHEEREKREEAETRTKIVTMLQQQREVYGGVPQSRFENIRRRLPVKDSHLWETEFNSGRLPRELPLAQSDSVGHLSRAYGVPAHLSDMITSTWAFYANFGPLFYFPAVSLPEFVSCLLDDGSTGLGVLIEELHIKILAKIFVERQYHADCTTGLPLTFSFYEKLPMVAKAKLWSLTPAEQDENARIEKARLSALTGPQLAAFAAEDEAVLHRQLKDGDAWFEVLRASCAQSQKIELKQYVDPVADCLSLIDSILNNQVAAAFSKPINTKTDAPGYLKVVKQPQDLGSIRKRIVSAHYDADFVNRKESVIEEVGVEDLKAEANTVHQGICHDVRTVWRNCYTYSGAGPNKPPPEEDDDATDAKGAEAPVVEAARMLSRQFEAGYATIKERAAKRDSADPLIRLEETPSRQDGPLAGMKLLEEEDKSKSRQNKRYKCLNFTATREGRVFEERDDFDWVHVLSQTDKVPSHSLLSLEAKIALLKWSQDEFLQTDFARKHLTAAIVGGSGAEEEEEVIIKKGRKRKAPAPKERGVKKKPPAAVTLNDSLSSHAPMKIPQEGGEAKEVVEQEVGSVKIASRVHPLARGDRFNNRYWILDQATTKERNNVANTSAQSTQTLAMFAPCVYVESFQTGEWHGYATVEDLTRLVCWLDERGCEENMIKAHILDLMASRGMQPDYEAIKAASCAQQQGLRLLRYGTNDLTPEEKKMSKAGGKKGTAPIAAAVPSSLPFHPPLPLRAQAVTVVGHDPLSLDNVPISLPTVSVAFMTDIKCSGGSLQAAAVVELPPPGSQKTETDSRTRHVPTPVKHVVVREANEESGLRVGDHLVACEGYAITSISSISPHAKAARSAYVQVLVRRCTYNAYDLPGYEEEDFSKGDPIGTYVGADAAMMRKAKALPKRCVGVILDILTVYQAYAQEEEDPVTAELVGPIAREMRRLIHEPPPIEAPLAMKSLDDHHMKRYITYVDILGDALMTIGRVLMGETESEPPATMLRINKNLFDGRTSRLRKRWLEMVHLASTPCQIAVLGNLLLMSVTVAARPRQRFHAPMGPI